MKGSTLSFTLLFIGTICFIFASISWFNAVQRGSSEFDRISSICESMQDDDPRKLPCLQQRNEAMDTGNNAGTAVAFVPAMIGLVCFVFAIVSI